VNICLGSISELLISQIKGTAIIRLPIISNIYEIVFVIDLVFEIL
jgi:hypothetical protein